MEEKRKYPRTEVDEPAYVSSGGSVMRCVVRNISQEGAAIDVENPASKCAVLIEQFEFVPGSDSLHKAWGVKQSKRLIADSFGPHELT